MAPQKEFPAEQIRQCNACTLRSGCRAPVPGNGPIPCRLMLISERPGPTEDRTGEPFSGAAGQLLKYLLTGIGVSREDCFTTNIVHCMSEKTPSDTQIKACAHWLDLEVAVVRPRIIMLMGAPAMKRMLGPDCGTVEHLHGQPVEKDGRIYLPTYNPASALYETSQLRFLYDDFQVLRKLLEGWTIPELLIKDEYPNPDYREITTRWDLSQLQEKLKKNGIGFADVETVNNKLWSVQVSLAPGSAYFIGGDLAKELYFDPETIGVFHNYLYDYKFLSVERYLDSMIMAYLCGLPQGLKELAYRICGLKMSSYTDLVRPYRRGKAMDYLTRASKITFPEADPIVESFWDNKVGRVIDKVRRPQQINKKIQRILSDVTKKGEEIDPYERWRKIEEVERACVEAQLGLMPDATIADAPHDEAVAYGCRDADATARIYYAMQPIIDELGVRFVLEAVDTPILKMVQEMMDTGFAVNVPFLQVLSAKYTAQMAAKAEELSRMVGHPFNPNSSPQVANVIYGELGYKPSKFTKTKMISTDDEELKKTGHPVSKGIIEYRRLQKIKSTYADAIVESAEFDPVTNTQRIHTTLRVTRVETGRLSSGKDDDGKGVNLQNQPTRNQEGKAIKKGFIASPGKRLMEGDLGQIEMRTQAHLAMCKNLIDMFLRGGDPHTEMAAKLFGVSMEEAKQDKYRYPVKRLNFGVIYLISGQGVAGQIQEYISDLVMEGTKVEIEPWTVDECDVMIRDWYKLNPEVRDYQLEKLAQARRLGYVSDMFGRIRYIPEVYCPIKSIQEAGARQAANMPVTCLPADTHVLIRAGWLPIGDFVDRTEVWTGERWAPAVRHEMGVNPRVRLHFSDGRTFDCDDGHKLLVQNGPWPEWKNVLEITDHDTVVLDWNSDWGQPIGEVEDWYWAGRFIGDGWLSGPAAKLKVWGIAFGSKELQDGERLTRWLDTKNIGGRNRATGAGYHYNFDKSKNFKIRGGTQDGYALWKSLGMTNRKAREKRIPPIVFTLDYARRKAFMDGYSDADGTAVRAKKRGRTVYSLCSASRGLLEDTVRLAQTLGLSARISEAKARTYDWPYRVGRGSFKVSTVWYCSILADRHDITVTKTEMLPAEQMYTLTVDDERHAFSSEGLISKNSSAQGIAKLAMARLWKERVSMGWPDHLRFLMQIHDSVIVEIDDDDEYMLRVARWMYRALTKTVQLVIPIDADFKWGYSWGDTKKLKNLMEEHA